MRHFKYILILVLTSLGLTSCDPYGGYEYWVHNQSDSTIYVVYSLVNNDTIKYKKLISNEEFMILKFDTHNGLYDEGLSSLFTFCDSLALYSDSTKNIHVTKRTTLRENWTYEQDKTSSFMNAGHNIYRFTIRNVDLK